MFNHLSKGFSTFELTIAIGFLFIVAAVFVFFIDPVEQARQKHDQRILSDTQEVLDSLSKFYVSFGRLPWADKVNTRELSPALSWRPLRASEIGICADENCEVKGELITSGKLSERLFASDTVLGRNGTAYLAKLSGTKASIFACFVPDSKVTRRKTGELVKVNLNLDFPKSGTLASCPTSTSWVEEDVCYLCITK